ncbi:hypothetical protein X768_22935 [Mesorhizobium sp. LSJC265A00]|nr:hypothetical protein X768_22935 [Mesorhizobium sp. LSJC265A00]
MLREAFRIHLVSCAVATYPTIRRQVSVPECEISGAVYVADLDVFSWFRLGDRHRVGGASTGNCDQGRRRILDGGGRSLLAFSI